MADSGFPVKDEDKAEPSLNNLPEYRETKHENSKNEDLDNLLDSALDDFEKVIAPPQGVKPATSEQQKQQDAENQNMNLNLFNNWSEEFLQQATSHFEDAVKNLLTEGNFGEDLGRFSTSNDSEKNDTNCEEKPSDLSASLASTLKELSDNAEAISNPLTDEEITQLLGSIGLSQDIGTNSDEPEEFINVMKNIMHNLLSKDLLYPALKDTTVKYPDWLNANKPTLSEADFNKYSRQYELMKGACDEYETEKESDTVEMKKERFERILEIMQKMQEFGHPPKELIGDMVSGLELDEQGLPKIPGLPLMGSGNESCSLM